MDGRDRELRRLREARERIRRQRELEKDLAKSEDKVESRKEKDEAEEEDGNFLTKAFDYLGSTVKQGTAGLAEGGRGILRGAEDTVDTFKDTVGLEDSEGDFEDKISDLKDQANIYAYQQGEPADKFQKFLRKTTRNLPGLGPAGYLADYGDELERQEEELLAKGYTFEEAEKLLNRRRALLSAGTLTAGLGNTDKTKETASGLKSRLQGLLSFD